MDMDKICPHCMHSTESSSRCTNCGKNPKNTTEITHQLPVFSKLQEKYLVGEILKEDEFGITYMGLNINTQVPVTIKEFYPTDSVARESVVSNDIFYNTDADAEMLEKCKEHVLQEAKGLSSCVHLPGIVSVKDYFRKNNTVYVVQEYVKGQTLQDYILSRGGKIPANELMPLFQTLISDLNEVHKQGVIHRNISPDSILVLKNGTLKIVDFGGAKNFCIQNDKSKFGLLKSGYVPEEQKRPRAIQGPWTDVYSLCATIYKCITGVTPVDAMERLGKDDMKWPTEMGISISRNQEEALKKGMSFISESRFQSMQELADAFYQAEVSGKSEGSNNIIGSIASNVKSMVDDVTHGFSSILNKTKGIAPKKENKTSKEDNVSVENTVSTENNVTDENAAPKETDNQAVTKEPKQPKQPKQNPLQNIKINKSVILAVVAVIVCICIIGGVIGFIGKNKGNKKENNFSGTEVAEEKESTEPLTETEDAESKDQPVSEANIKKLEELKATAHKLEGVDGWDVVLGTVDGILISNKDSEEVRELTNQIYNEYYQNALEYIAMIEGIEAFSADTYRECIIRYEELEKWNETLNCGYDDDLERNIDGCKQKYKEKFVERFDTKCVETLEQNGVVSRTVAWDAIQGIENTDLYNPSSTEDRYDPLRLRYIAAKVLKIHKDIDGLDIEDAFNMIRNAMVECDYDPMLIYLLYINGYEPAETWMMEVEYLIYRYAGEPDYRFMADNDRINFVYLYNAFPEEFKDCREAVIEYMEENYK